MAALPAFAIAQEQPLWELGLGVGALRVPHYRGSDQDHGWVLPVPYFVYNGEVLKPTAKARAPCCSSAAASSWSSA